MELDLSAPDMGSLLAEIELRPLVESDDDEDWNAKLATWMSLHPRAAAAYERHACKSTDELQAAILRQTPPEQPGPEGFVLPGLSHTSFELLQMRCILKQRTLSVHRIDSQPQDKSMEAEAGSPRPEQTHLRHPILLPSPKGRRHQHQHQHQHQHHQHQHRGRGRFPGLGYLCQASKHRSPPSRPDSRQPEPPTDGAGSGPLVANTGRRITLLNERTIGQERSLHGDMSSESEDEPRQESSPAGPWILRWKKPAPPTGPPAWKKPTTLVRRTELLAAGSNDGGSSVGPAAQATTFVTSNAPSVLFRPAKPVDVRGTWIVPQPAQGKDAPGGPSPPADTVPVSAARPGSTARTPLRKRRLGFSLWTDDDDGSVPAACPGNAPNAPLRKRNINHDLPVSDVASREPHGFKRTYLGNLSGSREGSDGEPREPPATPPQQRTMCIDCRLEPATESGLCVGCDKAVVLALTSSSDEEVSIIHEDQEKVLPIYVAKKATGNTRMGLPASLAMRNNAPRKLSSPLLSAPAAKPLAADELVAELRSLEDIEDDALFLGQFDAWKERNPHEARKLDVYATQDIPSLDSSIQRLVGFVGGSGSPPLHQMRCVLRQKRIRQRAHMGSLPAAQAAEPISGAAKATSLSLLRLSRKPCGLTPPRNITSLAPGPSKPSTVLAATGAGDVGAQTEGLSLRPSGLATIPDREPHSNTWINRGRTALRRWEASPNLTLGTQLAAAPPEAGPDAQAAEAAAAVTAREPASGIGRFRLARAEPAAPQPLEQQTAASPGLVASPSVPPVDTDASTGAAAPRAADEGHPAARFHRPLAKVQMIAGVVRGAVEKRVAVLRKAGAQLVLTEAQRVQEAAESRLKELAHLKAVLQEAVEKKTSEIMKRRAAAQRQAKAEAAARLAAAEQPAAEATAAAPQQAAAEQEAPVAVAEQTAGVVDGASQADQLVAVAAAATEHQPSGAEVEGLAAVADNTVTAHREAEAVEQQDSDMLVEAAPEQQVEQQVEQRAEGQDADMLLLAEAVVEQEDAAMVIAPAMDQQAEEPMDVAWAWPDAAGVASAAELSDPAMEPVTQLVTEHATHPDVLVAAAVEAVTEQPVEAATPPISYHDEPGLDQTQPLSLEVVADDWAARPIPQRAAQPNAAQPEEVPGAECAAGPSTTEEVDLGAQLAGDWSPGPEDQPPAGQEGLDMGEQDGSARVAGQQVPQHATYPVEAVAEQQEPAALRPVARWDPSNWVLNAAGTRWQEVAAREPTEAAADLVVTEEMEAEDGMADGVVQERSVEAMVEGEDAPMHAWDVEGEAVHLPAGTQQEEAGVKDQEDTAVDREEGAGQAEAGGEGQGVLGAEGQEVGGVEVREEEAGSHAGEEEHAPRDEAEAQAVVLERMEEQQASVEATEALVEVQQAAAEVMAALGDEPSPVAGSISEAELAQRVPLHMTAATPEPVPVPVQAHVLPPTPAAAAAAAAPMPATATAAAAPVLEAAVVAAATIPAVTAAAAPAMPAIAAAAGTSEVAVAPVAAAGSPAKRRRDEQVPEQAGEQHLFKRRAVRAVAKTIMHGAAVASAWAGGAAVLWLGYVYGVDD